MIPGRRILVCDDDAAVRSSLDFLLKKAGYEPVTVGDQPEVLKNIRESDFSLVLLDMNLSMTTTGEEGIEILRKIKTLKPEIPVILITAWGSIELAVRGIKLGAYDFITKPWNNLRLLRIIETAISLSAKDKEVRTASEKAEGLPGFTGIIGKDPVFAGIIGVIRRVAPTHAPVLITGESGTGKELIASALHYYSPRKGNPFIKVNLGGIPAGLFESEMFGYRKGAFTDAKSDHTGRFEKADKGTIFLDEIGDLAHSSQVKLLRVLQDQTFERLGDSDSISVDVRIISATNRNLYSLVDKGAFREDLLYRINLIQIEVPPLRKRKDDIPLLAEYFIENSVRMYSVAGKSISPDGMEWLLEQPWPGNVRELKNIVERTVLLTAGDRLTADDFRSARGSGGHSAVKHDEGFARGTIDEMEKAMILKVIGECGGNLSRSAEKLGIGRATLYRKLEKYGIQQAGDE